MLNPDYTLDKVLLILLPITIICSYSIFIIFEATIFYLSLFHSNYYYQSHCNNMTQTLNLLYMDMKT